LYCGGSNTGEGVGNVVRSFEDWYHSFLPAVFALLVARKQQFSYFP
jgi:hypothetical protein